MGVSGDLSGHALIALVSRKKIGVNSPPISHWDAKTFLQPNQTQMAAPAAKETTMKRLFKNLFGVTKPIKSKAKAGRVRLGLEALEDRSVPAALVGLSDGVLRVDCDDTYSTIHLSHTGQSTILNGFEFADAEISRVEINAGPGGSRIRIDGTPAVAVAINGGAGNDDIYIHSSASPSLTVNPNGPSGGIDTVNVGATTLNPSATLDSFGSGLIHVFDAYWLNVDDSAGARARTVTLDRNAFNGRVLGMGPGTMTYTAGGIDHLFVTGSNVGSKFWVDNPAPRYNTSLTTGMDDDQVNIQAMSVGQYVFNPGGRDALTLGSNGPGGNGTMANITSYISIGDGSYGDTDVIVDNSGDAVGRAITVTDGWNIGGLPSWQFHARGASLTIRGGVNDTFQQFGEANIPVTFVPFGADLVNDRVTASYSTIDGVLRIRGTAGADDIRIVQNANHTLSVTGVRIRWTNGFDVSETDSISVLTVNRVEVEARAGNDRVTFDDAQAMDFATKVVFSGGDGNDTLTGGMGDDTLIGDGNNDWLVGGGGNDVLYGNDGEDTIFGDLDTDPHGGTGDDQLYGGGENDHLVGQGGNDFLSGDGGDDVMYGNDGRDTLYGDLHTDPHGGTGNDQLYGGGENDHLVGQGGNDFLSGDGGDDVLYGNDGRDTLYGDLHTDPWGGTGNDTLYGGGENDHLVGQGGNDLLAGEGGDDTLYGNDGHDTLWGDYENDWLLTNGNDQLFGGSGFDTLQGGWGNDTLRGEADEDKLFGGWGNDELRGGDHRDELFGDLGNDQLFGDAGDDWLYGENNDDDLYGGQGLDHLYGGQGNDGLFGGTGDAADVLTGGADLDRFLRSAEDVVLDNVAEADGLIHFTSDGAGVWTDQEIELIDKGLGWLHTIRGNTTLLRHGDDDMTFQRVLSLGANVMADNDSDGRIRFANWAFQAGISADVTAVHELLHNWDTEGAYWDDWLKLSGWESRHILGFIPVATGKEISIDGDWVYSWDAAFARGYGRNNPLDDWCTTWEAYYVRDVYPAGTPLYSVYNFSGMDAKLGFVASIIAAG
jgi:Ca2+-binding RTX toxin-like protein